MGYKRQQKLLKLKFEDDEYEGLEVICKSLPVGQMMAVTALASKVRDKDADMENINGLFVNFAKALVSWNLEDDQGNPVPPNLEGVKSQDLDFVLSIVLAWMENASSVSRPLPQSSNGGQQSPEASIPMEEL